MSRWLVAITLATGCGRFDFDETTDAAIPDVPLPVGSLLDIDARSGLGDLTFMRPTTAMYVDSTGKLRNAEPDEPRFDHDPVTLAPRGLLLETASRNLITHASGLEVDTTWFRNGNITVTSDVAVAPDGTLTADQLDDAETAIDARRAQGVVVATTPQPWVFSAFVRAGSLDRMTFGAELLGGASQLQTHVDLDIVTGEQTPAGFGVVAHGSEAYGGGWRRVWMRLDNNATGNYDALLSLCNDRTMTSAVGSFYAWGAQLEQASAPTSYMPTADAERSRGADQLTGTLQDLPTGTLLVRARPAFDHDAARIVACVGGISGACMSRQGLTDRVQLTVGVQTIDGATWPAGTERTLLMTWDEAQVRLWDAGSSISLTGTPSARNALLLGGLDGHVQRIVYWPRVLDDAEIAALVP